jgi:hypothetical protein
VWSTWIERKILNGPSGKLTVGMSAFVLGVALSRLKQRFEPPWGTKNPPFMADFDSLTVFNNICWLQNPKALTLSDNCAINDSY